MVIAFYEEVKFSEENIVHDIRAMVGRAIIDEYDSHVKFTLTFRRKKSMRNY